MRARGYILTFLNFLPPTGLFHIYMQYLYTWPPLLSSGQSSWLQIQRSWFDSRRYQIFWEVVGLKRGPLSLVSTTEELLETKSSGSGQESREYGRRDPSCWPSGTVYPQKLTLTLTSGGRSVGIVRSRTQATEFVIHLYLYIGITILQTFITGDWPWMRSLRNKIGRCPVHHRRLLKWMHRYLPQDAIYTVVFTDMIKMSLCLTN
jgi:hypothetical protein